MNIMELSKSKREEIKQIIVQLRAQNKTNSQIAHELNKTGIVSPSGRPLDDKVVSAFAVKNGLRVKNFTGRAAPQTDLENDLLEIIGSKLSKNTKVKCLLALLN